MSTPEDQIVFEDLHGLQEKEPVTVDLDADDKSTGIQTAPDGQSVVDDDGDDDSLQLDGLRSAEAGDEPAADTQTTEKKTASNDSDDDSYSKKVKARIQRATRATTKERERGDYWEKQAKDLAKDSYERDKTNLTNTVEQADSQLENTQSQLEAAIEAGDTKEQVRLTTQLNNQTAAKVRAEVALENLAPDGNVQPFDGKVTPEGKKDTDSLSDQWMEDRSDWYRQEGFERQTRLANRLDREVYADGYLPDTKEYFEELDRRIKEKSPELYDEVDTGADDGKQERRQGKNVVAPIGGNETRHQNTSSSKVELDAEDFATMRQFNLDPNDPEVLKEFARNKREAELGAKQ